MERTIRTLIFVYNADGGVFHAIGDMVHKILSPSTYPCSLCALTYGPFTMRAAWRNFLDKLGLPVFFLYRDEFRKDLDQCDIALPAIMLGGETGAPEVLVSAAELADLRDLSALIALVETRMALVSG
jgi:hypothetical protein